MITLGECSVSDHPPSHAAEFDLLNDNLTEKAPITLLTEDDEARLPIHYRLRVHHELPFLFGVLDEFAERAVRRGSCSGERTRRTSSGACSHSERIFLFSCWRRYSKETLAKVHWENHVRFHGHRYSPLETYRSP